MQSQKGGVCDKFFYDIFWVVDGGGGEGDRMGNGARIEIFSSLTIISAR